MLVYSNTSVIELLQSRPQLDREASIKFAQELFPSEKLSSLEDGSLSYTNPSDDQLVVGCFPGLSIVAAKEFGLDYPSRLTANFVNPALGQTIYLHAMHSSVDWFAFAVWRDGQLQRSVCLSPDSGILEDIGARLAFEEPYWAGQHPAIDPEEDSSSYPFVFHPLELGEAALLELFGYQLEGSAGNSLIDAENLPLMRFKRSKSWWKIW